MCNCVVSVCNCVANTHVCNCVANIAIVSPIYVIFMYIFMSQIKVILLQICVTVSPMYVIVLTMFICMSPIYVSVSRMYVFFSPMFVLVPYLYIIVPRSYRFVAIFDQVLILLHGQALRELVVSSIQNLLLISSSFGVHNKADFFKICVANACNCFAIGS